MGQSMGQSDDETSVRERRQERRPDRLAAYDELRSQRPELFDNPPGAAFEILLDRAEQDQVAAEMSAAAVSAGFSEDCGDIGVVHLDPYLRLVRDAVRFPSGRTGTYIRAVGDPTRSGAAALPLLSDGRIVLVHHFRHADRAWHWEIPRGFGERDEDGMRTARREAREELDCPVGEAVYLGDFISDSGRSGDRDVLCLVHVDAADFREEPGAEAREEGISEIRAVTPAEFHTMLLDGEVSDAYTLAAYGLATARGLFRPPDH